MYRTPTIASVISKSINEVDTKDRFAKMIAETITDTVKTEESQQTNASPEKTEYYVTRAFEEIANAIKDINFELGSILEGEKPEIMNIATDADNNTKVYITKKFGVADHRDAPKARTAISGVKIAPNFEKYLVVTVGNDQETVSLDMILTLNSDYVNSIGGDDFKKRAMIVDKQIKRIIDETIG